MLNDTTGMQLAKSRLRETLQDKYSGFFNKKGQRD